MKFLVTGATGFTGSYVLNALRNEGFEAIGSSRYVRDTKSRDFLSIDFLSKESIDVALSEIRPDIIIHLAGISFVGHSVDIDFYKTNVIGVENLLSLISENDYYAPKRVILASSANVYGVPNVIYPLSEQHLPRPVNHYAISKLAMEYTALRYFDAIPITIVRPFNYIGGGQSSSFVIPKIVSAYASNERSIELGNIQVSRDFSDVRDVANAYLEICKSEKTVSQIYNICSGVATSIDHVIKYMNSLSGYKMNVLTNPEFFRKNEIPTLIGSNQKLKKDTAWQPEFTIEQTLDHIYYNFKVHK